MPVLPCKATNVAKMSAIKLNREDAPTVQADCTGTTLDEEPGSSTADMISITDFGQGDTLVGRYGPEHSGESLLVGFVEVGSGPVDGRFGRSETDAGLVTTIRRESTRNGNSNDPKATGQGENCRHSSTLASRSSSRRRSCKSRRVGLSSSDVLGEKGIWLCSSSGTWIQVYG